jgi:hypothetical protein
VLDASGSASIWLSTAAYKIVLEDVNNVVQWTVDNVSAVSQAELQGVISFSSISVTGNSTIGGSETVDGTLTAASRKPPAARTYFAIISRRLRARRRERRLFVGARRFRSQQRYGRHREGLIFLHEHKPVLLHGFVKKTQKTPTEDLRIALKRKGELENG